MSSIPYGHHRVTTADITAVVDVLKSEYLTQGPVVPVFEQELAKVVGARYAVAVNSATSALHIACLALDVGPGDIVWTSSITFVASANCVRFCGANIDFLDIDLATYNIDIEKLKVKLEYSAMSGCLPKVVIPVHIAGLSCNMAEINKLAQIYGFRVIEDASHAIGGSYEGSPIGNCRYSDIVIFSFHPVKIITTAEGGIAVCNDPLLASRMSKLRSHGISRDLAEMTELPHGPWFYQQLELGFNYRMTELQAALGISQLKRLNEIVLARRRLADRYDELLNNSIIQIEPKKSSECSAHHLYVILLMTTVSRLKVFTQMQKAEIGVNVHYIPVYFHPYYANLGFTKGYCPVSEDYYWRALTLPLYPELTHNQQDYIVNSLKEILCKGDVYEK